MLMFNQDGKVELVGPPMDPITTEEVLMMKGRLALASQLLSSAWDDGDEAMLIAAAADVATCLSNFASYQSLLLIAQAVQRFEGDPDQIQVESDRLKELVIAAEVTIKDMLIDRALIRSYETQDGRTVMLRDGEWVDVTDEMKDESSELMTMLTNPVEVSAEGDLSAAIEEAFGA